jgi:hypothetical protein
MKHKIYTSGLILLVLLTAGIVSSNAQVRIGLHLQFGEPVRVLNPYYTDLAANYNVPYDAIYEMHYAGISDKDMPIILYIKANSRYNLQHIYNLRARGATWEQLSTWCGVKLFFDGSRIYFRNDTPPFGNAYGYHKNHPGKHKDDYAFNGSYDKHPGKHK